MKDGKKAKRLCVQLGTLEPELRKHAAERNLSLNAAVCVAVSRMLTPSNIKD